MRTEGSLRRVWGARLTKGTIIAGVRLFRGKVVRGSLLGIFIN
jgi:hypothetical protein